MLFGRSLFGGALFTGIITVSGIAVCAATTSANQQVTRYSSGQVAAKATVFGDAVRTAKPAANPAMAYALATGWSRGDVPLAGAGTAFALAQASPLAKYFGTSSIQCVASASGAAFVNYHGFGSAQADAKVNATGLVVTVGVTPVVAQATVTAKPQVNFLLQGIATASATGNDAASAEMFLSGLATGDATATGKVQRRFRMPFQAPARAYADGEGEGQSWLLVAAKPARAYATLFGTTYFVGQGKPDAVAYADGYPIRSVGAKAKGKAYAQGQGAAINTGGAISSAVATASAFADAAVSIDGALHYEVFGYGVGQAKLDSAVTVYQPQTGYALAFASAQGWQLRGAKTDGRAIAILQGYSVTLQTGIAGTPATCMATATAAATHFTGLTGSGQAKALVTAAAVIKNTKTYTKQVNGVATVTARPSGRMLLKGRGDTNARLNAIVLRYAVAKGRTEAYANLKAEATVLVIGGANAQAMADAKGLQEVIKHAEGSLEATAALSGYMQINDLVHAPADRTVTVITQERVSVVEAFDRLVIV